MESGICAESNGKKHQFYLHDGPGAEETDGTAKDDLERERRVQPPKRRLQRHVGQRVRRAVPRDIVERAKVGRDLGDRRGYCA